MKTKEPRVKSQDKRVKIEEPKTETEGRDRRVLGADYEYLIQSRGQATCMLLEKHIATICKCQFF